MKYAIVFLWICLPRIVLCSESELARVEKGHYNNVRSMAAVRRLQSGLKVYKASADLLAANIAGDGVTITSATLTGRALQAGLFTGGQATVGINSGAILSTGKVDEVEGPNDGQFPPSDYSEPGYTPLENLTGNSTHDAAVLTIIFQCESAGPFSFTYVFGSEDYSSANKGFAWEDAMGAFLNGLEPSDNIALVNGSYVSVKTINCSPGNSLCKYFVNNVNATTEMNGFTKVLKAKGNALAGSNILNIAIADGFDGNYPSWVLIGQGSMTCQPKRIVPVPTPTPRTTSVTVCMKSMTGCPCINQAQLVRCITRKAQSSCTLPTGKAKNAYVTQLVRRYKSTKCK